MGQQQLVVIVLGVLVVGLAVYTGVQLVRSNNQSNDEQLIKDQMNLVVSEAVQYAAKLTSMGGGDGSFNGFQPPNNLLTTTQVQLTTSFSDLTIIFQGYGTVTGMDGKEPVTLVGEYNRARGGWVLIERVN